MKLGSNGEGDRIPGARQPVFTVTSSAAAERKQQRTAPLSVKRTQPQTCKWHGRPSVQLLFEKLHCIAPPRYSCQLPWCLKAKLAFLSCQLSTFLAFLTLCYGSEIAWKAHLNLSCLEPFYPSCTSATMQLQIHILRLNTEGAQLQWVPSAQVQHSTSTSTAKRCRAVLRKSTESGLENPVGPHLVL